MFFIISDLGSSKLSSIFFNLELSFKHFPICNLKVTCQNLAVLQNTMQHTFSHNFIIRELRSRDHFEIFKMGNVAQALVFILFFGCSTGARCSQANFRSRCLHPVGDPPFHGGLTPLAHRCGAWGGYPGWQISGAFSVIRGGFQRGPPLSWRANPPGSSLWCMGRLPGDPPFGADTTGVWAKWRLSSGGLSTWTPPFLRG